LQELFIKLARGVKPGALSEKAFLYRIAHNLAIDWLRRRSAQKDAQERLSKELDTTPRWTDSRDDAVLAAGFARAMQSLPQEQMTVVQLKLIDGLTFDEIAAVQGVPLNTAASRWRYAIERLRSILRPLYEEIQ
jgi:RNA polymerase sigma-70 factor (ECF subfamily)